MDHLWTARNHTDVISSVPKPPLAFIPVAHSQGVLVPARYVTIWLGSPLPYTAILSIASMLQAHPGAVVELHVPPGFVEPAHLRALRHHRRFRTVEIDLDRVLPTAVRAVFDSLPPDAHAARANILRIALLHERGGIYVDLDTFVLSPLTALASGPFAGLERVWAHDRERVERGLRLRHWPGTAAWGVAWACKRFDSTVLHGAARSARWLRPVERLWTREQLNNAVLGTPAASDLTAAMLDRIAATDPTARYALGPHLLSDTVATMRDRVTVLDVDALYAVPPAESHRFFHDRTLHLPAGAALVHYVNSNHRKLLARVTPGDPRFLRPELFWRLARAAEQSLYATDDRALSA